MRVWLRRSLLALPVVLIFLSGCGSGSDSDTDAIDRAAAVERAATARKIERLRDELRSRKALLKAKREQKARRAGLDAQSAESAGGVSESSFRRLASEIGGELGAAIGPPGSGRVRLFGDLRSGPAWSTSKVPISLRLLSDVGGPSGLSPTQAEQMSNALTLSDNQAASALFAELERRYGGLAGASTAIDAVLREGGDYSTTISTQGRGEFSTYGQTDWSLENQQRFMSSLAAGCVVGMESSEYVLDLMGEVSSDTWGLGSAGLPARWKGGWGPGRDGRYLVRQMGVLYIGDRETAVTLVARPDDGQFATAQSMATRLAEWLADQSPRYAERSHEC